MAVVSRKTKTAKRSNVRKRTALERARERQRIPAFLRADRDWRFDHERESLRTLLLACGVSAVGVLGLVWLAITWGRA